MGSEILCEQIKDGGLGDEIWTEADMDDGSMVRLQNLMNYIHSVSAGLETIKYLLTHFANVEILEHCGQYFKLRIPKEDKTIGWLFGYIENMKDSLQI